MNVYTYIRKFAEAAEVNVETSDVSRIAGALRTAGFRGDLSEREMEMARPLIATRIGRVAGSKPRVADSEEKAPKKEKAKKEDHTVEGSKDAATFEKIDAMVKQGKCARCGQPTEQVALANYEEAHFCPQCRTTLW